MPAIEGLILMPGAGGTKDHPTLLALEEALSPLPVLRHEFSYRSEGRRPPPRAPKLVAELRNDYEGLIRKLGCDPKAVIFGGRSMGGRICSMAAAESMPTAGLLLLSYPLHPPTSPEKLRVDHFENIESPTLFVSGNNDPFGSPEEFKQREFNKRKRYDGIFRRWTSRPFKQSPYCFDCGRSHFLGVCLLLSPAT